MESDEEEDKKDKKEVKLTRADRARLKEEKEQRKKYVSQALKKNEVFKEIHRAKKRRYYYHIRSAPYQYMQIDLLDVANLKDWNDQISYLVVAVDVYSRYIFVQPIRNKSQFQEVFPLMLKKMKPKPKFIYSDVDSVFQTPMVKQALDKYHIQWDFMEAGAKTPTSIVERANLKLRRMIHLFLTNKGNDRNQDNPNRYIDELPDIVAVYNGEGGEEEAINKTTKKTPTEIYIDKEKWKDTRPDGNPDLHIGDYVRVRRKDVSLFAKKSTSEYWSREVYQIVGNASMFRYTIQEIDSNEPEPQNYKPEDLLKIDYLKNKDSADEYRGKASEHEEALRKVKAKRFVQKELHGKVKRVAKPKAIVIKKRGRPPKKEKK